MASGDDTDIVRQIELIGEDTSGLGMVNAEEFPLEFKNGGQVPVLHQLEFDFSHLVPSGPATAAISFAGIALPMAMGAGLAYWLYPRLVGEASEGGPSFGNFQLFLAVSMAITALPILGRLLVEWGAARTRLATIAISSAAMDDAMGWILLATIAAFVRGQAGICLILGSFYAIALMLIGLNFGFLIGFISGLISFIPYVGSITGFLLGCIVAVAQFWPQGMPVVLVVCVFLVGQLLEGYVLAPKLVGEKVGLHPVWLMFALIAFGYLFGFVGLLVAVPVSAAIGVLLRFGLKQYRASPIYTGEAR